MLKSLLSAIRTVLVALVRVLLCQYGVAVSEMFMEDRGHDYCRFWTPKEERKAS